MKHMLLWGVVFTASVANALYLADCDQDVNCVCRADRKGQLKLDNGKLFVCTESGWNLYEEYGDESQPGSSCKDIKNHKGEESANGIYWIKLEGEDEAFQVYCDMESGGWTMVFKAVAGVKDDVYKLYCSRQTSSENKEEALDVTNTFHHHYKNRIVSNWKKFKPCEARVALYEGGNLKKELKFNATNSNANKWFSRSALTQSSWFDIQTQSQNFFTIPGANNELTKRRFFINRNYGGCPEDAGWMVITEKHHCSWETHYKKTNAILYSKLPVFTNWNKKKNVLEADVLVVYVR